MRFRLNGITLPHLKKTKGMSPVKMDVPKTLYFPMHQNLGAPAVPSVKVGDEVFVGTLIATAGGKVGAPIYSSVSGKVKRIEDAVQPNGAFSPTILIESDGAQTPDPAIAPPAVTDRESFLAAVVNSGVVGLGGAGFPTAVKLGVKDPSKIEHVIINGAECEPYITSDTRTMLDRDDDICEGIELIKKYLGVKSFIFGIEKNKPLCIKLMTKTAGAIEGVKIAPLPSVYPQGGEKVLIYHTTGKVVGEGKLPIDVGVIVINCTTLAEIARYIRTGMPLTEKCVTVDGSCVKEPKNLIVPIGTPARDVFEACGGLTEDPGKVIYGGPMMGVSVADIEAPVLKQTNALLALNKKESAPKRISNCIRCGRCTNTCPFGLAPVSIVTAYENKDMEELASLKANLCMECGCCSFVCPANRPLVQQNKLAKAALACWIREKKDKEEKK
ncbi:MAG: electron transport complex subunit RsxC [Ruminococcaceae bacterium]|nr:electron transport complex subunit RsxC [Oscillospiraceae bacterium]